MTDGRPRSGARTALIKASLAAAGVAFFVLALALLARWAYAPGAVLLVASVLAGRRPKDRT
ncbi:hypothetical protein [Streptomyces sp. NPDC005989]|uniref:hypothetical protein n=1 Tax=unclassified Streptomyces TaxID=2593676 RepID=UPI0033C67111